MVGFVVVSHSKALAEETIRLAEEMRRDIFPLINGSGVEGEYFGSNPLNIKEGIEKAMTENGVMIFVDLGSSIFNTEIALELLKEEGKDISKIKIADAPLVEGLIAAVAMNDKKAKLEDIVTELAEFKAFSKINN